VNDRIGSLRSWMAAHETDAVLLIDPANQQYVTGFKALIYSRPILTLLTPDELCLVVPGLEERHAQEEARADRLLVYYEHPDAPGPDTDPLAVALRRLAGLRGARRLGVEARKLPLGWADAFRESGWTLTDAGGEVHRMRLVKDAAEMTLIRQASELVSAAVAASLAASRPGETELAIEAPGNALILQEASRRFPGATVDHGEMSPSGTARTVLPHVFSTTRAIEPGDVIIHTRQVGVRGYRSECERTYFVGAPRLAEQRQAFAAAVAAQQAALEAVRAGVSCRAVDEAARAVFRRGGLERWAIHRTGHGIGLEPHEAPSLRFDEPLPLEVGMVLTIEPGIYIPGVGGFRHSDTVLVTEGGCEILTTGPRRVEELMLEV
jgi:Xaa-Pro dipeptidase